MNAPSKSDAAATPTPVTPEKRTDAAIHLEHVNINIRDIGRTLAFYRKLLPAWVVRWEGVSDSGGRWVHFGPPGGGQPGYLSLMEEPGEIPASGEPDGPGFNHFGFSHPDVGALVARLRGEGIDPYEFFDRDGYRRAYFKDPDARDVEFVQKLG